MPATEVASQGPAEITYQLDREAARRQLAQAAKTGGLVEVDKQAVGLIRPGPLDAILPPPRLDEKRRTVPEIARVLKPGAELHVADWRRPSDPLMRVLSLQVHFGDGTEPTRENLPGALPRIFEQGGLVDVAEAGHLRTPFRTLAYYRAELPGSRLEGKVRRIDP